MKQGKKITYGESGVDYEQLDPVKKHAQTAAKKTAIHLSKAGFREVEETRGESAFVWKQGNVMMASVIEGLGTKNLVADAMRKITGKTYYDQIGYDTMSAVINDLITVGAKPLVVHAYWAVGDSAWLADQERMKDLVKGWKTACDDTGATWGGGETPAYKGIINPQTIDLGGSAVGIVKNKKQLITERKLKRSDRILLIKSSGINVNGLSLARAIAEKLPKGYATIMKSGKMYGEALLTKSHIYARLIQDLFKGGVDIHYLVNITGHGLRKVMRARQNFSYVLENIFAPQEIFSFIQEAARLDDYEMYQTFNMGMDFAIFLPAKDVKKAQKIITKNKFISLDAGYVERGEKRVIIEPKKIIFKGETLNLR